MKESDARAGGSIPRPDDLVDETSDESFPASDPPGWSLLHAGGAVRAHDQERPGEHGVSTETDAVRSA